MLAVHSTEGGSKACPHSIYHRTWLHKTVIGETPSCDPAANHRPWAAAGQGKIPSGELLYDENLWVIDHRSANHSSPPGELMHDKTLQVSEQEIDHVTPAANHSSPWIVVKVRFLKGDLMNDCALHHSTWRVNPEGETPKTA